MYGGGYSSSRPMLTLYDIHRRPRRVPSGRWHVSSSFTQVLHSFKCVICWSTLRNPKLVRECLHRFCEDCIEKSLRLGRNECPVCRVFVPSKRNLATDEGCEVLIDNVLGPTLRNEELDEVMLKEVEAQEIGKPLQVDNDDGNSEAEDHHGMPTRYSTRRVRSVYAERPKKRTKGTQGGSASADDANEEEEDDEDDTPPVLLDFLLLPHRDEQHLVKLELPYIRLSGDATVATIIKFIQAKLSVDKPIQLTASVGSRKLGEKTPLHLVANVTHTLYYRLTPRSHSAQRKQGRATKTVKNRAVLKTR